MPASDVNIDQLRLQVARACRILARTGISPGILGHVSTRVGDRILVRCRPPGERGLLFTTAEDIRLVDLDGYGDLCGGYSVPNELPLHTEIYRHRPETRAVVHAHPPSVVAANLAGVALRPLVGAFNIPATRLAATGIPVYERAVLIRRPDLAREMLDAMGPHNACVLRGHGISTAGPTIEHAVATALNVDELARMSLEVTRGGGTPTAIPPEDLAELPDLGSGFNDTLIWQHEIAQLSLAGLDVAAPKNRDRD